MGGGVLGFMGGGGILGVLEFECDRCGTEWL